MLLDLLLKLCSLYWSEHFQVHENLYGNPCDHTYKCRMTLDSKEV